MTDITCEVVHPHVEEIVAELKQQIANALRTGEMPPILNELTGLQQQIAHCMATEAAEQVFAAFFPEFAAENMDELVNALYWPLILAMIADQRLAMQVPVILQ